MKDIRYINPKGIKEIIVQLESESSFYDWLESEPEKRKTILWGLITIGKEPAMRAGWGSRRLTDEEVLQGWNSIKIDRSGLEPKLLSKARATIYFGYKHYSTCYYESNEEAINCAEEIANESGCSIKIEG
jgi:hypothetical protein